MIMYILILKNVIELDNHIVDLDYINIGIYEHETMITPTIEPNESQNIEINKYSIVNINYVSVSKNKYIISFHLQSLVVNLVLVFLQFASLIQNFLLIK